MEDDITRQADEILSAKNWADFTFDTFWALIKEHWSEALWGTLNANPQLEQQARKFYEKVTPKWFGDETLEEEIRALDTDQRALFQSIRMASVYGFICGYVTRYRGEVTEC